MLLNIWNVQNLWCKDVSQLFWLLVKNTFISYFRPTLCWALNVIVQPWFQKDEALSKIQTNWSTVSVFLLLDFIHSLIHAKKKKGLAGKTGRIKKVHFSTFSTRWRSYKAFQSWQWGWLKVSRDRLLLSNVMIYLNMYFNISPPGGRSQTETSINK